MLLTVIALVCLLSVVSIRGQLMFLDDVQPQTPCTEGLREGMDAFVVNATIYSFPMFVALGWETKVSLEILTESSLDFVEMCSIEIGEEGQFCGLSAHDGCYCDSFDNATGDVEVVISHNAEMNISEGILRLKWNHPSEEATYSQNNVTLPRVYDVYSANLELKVNGKPVSESADCNYNVITSSYNQIELCCSNTATPCFPRVTVKHFTFPGNTSQCIRYDFMMHSGKFQSTMMKSYAVCSVDKYYMSGSCIAQSRFERTDNTNYFIYLMFSIPIGLILYVSAKMVHVVLIKKGQLQAAAPDFAGKSAPVQYQAKEQPLEFKGFT